MEAALFDQIRQFATRRGLRAVFSSLMLLSLTVWLMQPALAAQSAMSTSTLHAPLAFAEPGNPSQLLEPDGEAITEAAAPNDVDHGSTVSDDDLSDPFAIYFDYRLFVIADSLLRDDPQHAPLRVVSETFRPPIA